MLNPNEKINIREILKDLDKYKPKRYGWTFRKKLPKHKIGICEYYEVSDMLKNSIPLPASRQMDYIDPQPDITITVEIASGRFEDDIRRMRMAAWHGADHIMVIRTLGQSHFDGLIEGTPEGVGGIPITRKQIRATRKALDLIEEEVGREINLHSYVSGIAGPEIAVLFAEEGVNGAHQDPQYNILYRNINPIRSFVDAGVSKKIMSAFNMIQIDGAHNANATAKYGFKVMPELLVQHAINSLFSIKVGMKNDYIALSTVPPDASPFPSLRLDIPYANILRKVFKGFRFRAQMNTKYVESCTREATVNHALNALISRLTSADIQSTITPDEGRNVPWHYNSIHAINTAKQTLIAADGIKNVLKIRDDEEEKKREREILERAILFLEEIIEVGGYFNALEKGFFVDSGFYPERVGDGIKRPHDKGDEANTVVKREKDYLAPVCHHFGYNNLPKGLNKPCDLIDGCTFCKREKIVYIDELDPEDNVDVRLKHNEIYDKEGMFKPEVQWKNDGIILVSMFLPISKEKAPYAAIEIGKKLGLLNVEVIHQQVLHPAEGSYIEIKGEVPFFIKESEIKVPEKIVPLKDEEIVEEIKRRGGIKCVAATLGEDEHNVGLKEIINIKHGGLEKWGFQVTYLGTSVPPEKVINAAIEVGANIVLASTTVTHGNVHKLNLKKLNDVAIEKGVREKLIIIGGGTQLSQDTYKEVGIDGTFGRGTKGIEVASFIIRKLREKDKK
jgi:D-ornithine 4,5-aminomutase subunit beta